MQHFSVEIDIQMPLICTNNNNKNEDNYYADESSIAMTILAIKTNQ